MAAFLALGSALTLGAADFLGGLASRRARVLIVALLSQVAGAVVILFAAPLVGGELTQRALVVGGLTGLAGVIGTLAYFRALATGPMGASAQLAALVGAVVPVAFGLADGERPHAVAAVGMVIGVVAAGLISLPTGQASETRRIARRAAAWALLGGAGFGLFLVGLDRAPDDSGLWPLVGARAVSIPILVLLVLTISGSGQRASWPWRLGLASGIFDMTANTLFLLSTRAGLLSVTSVLASLYPAVVAVLAGVLLRERLSSFQRLGVPAALASVAMMAT